MSSDIPPLKSTWRMSLYWFIWVLNSSLVGNWEPSISEWCISHGECMRQRVVTYGYQIRYILRTILCTSNSCIYIYIHTYSRIQAQDAIKKMQFRNNTNTVCISPWTRAFGPVPKCQKSGPQRGREKSCPNRPCFGGSATKLWWRRARSMEVRKDVFWA